jgi:hypothetical protein
MSTDMDGRTMEAGRLSDGSKTWIAVSHLAWMHVCCLVLCRLGIASGLFLDHKILQNIYCNQCLQFDSEQEYACESTTRKPAVTVLAGTFYIP